MPQPTVRIASAQDQSAVLDVLTLAFSTDPMCRWCWPEPGTHLRHFPEFTRAFAGAAFRTGSAYFVEGYRGAALWLPPGEHPDHDAVGDVVQRSVAPELQADLAAVIGEMERSHPAEPHWFLPLIGVDPIAQGSGHGAALLQRSLEVCDREKKLAYLDSTNPRNVSLYQRHGFEVLREIQIGTSPTVRPMLRKPR